MAEQSKSGVESAFRRKKILVVDDDADAAELVSRLLEGLGHEVRRAYAPREAIQIAIEYQPDVAFLDIGLPLMDGFELAAKLSALPELRDCRFIAITGYDDADDRKQSARIGFEAHLMKPVSTETLQRVLAGLEPNQPKMSGFARPRQPRR
ncbi:MAG TPA: response regulator [Polyangiaceae bacterium]|nr:response regulator [Polyangiaceae bacterium]